MNVVQYAIQVYMDIEHGSIVHSCDAEYFVSWYESVSVIILITRSGEIKVWFGCQTTPNAITNIKKLL